MSYFPHSQKEINEMLKKIGLTDLTDLTAPIPDQNRIKELNLQDGKTELEISEVFTALSKKNTQYNSIFLGVGAYNHYIPAAVDELAGRQEFYTAYTPYQAEISQGTLRAIFEYQSYITALTGMDVSNASLYDGATALVEASLIAVNVTRKKKILVDQFVNPQYLQTLYTYLSPKNIEIVLFPSNPFKFDLSLFEKHWNKEFAAFIISSPNYLGSIVDFKEASTQIHLDKGLLIQSISEALSLSILAPPVDFSVDIVCGEAMSFGNPLAFGGPYLGFIATTKKYLRKIPGRIVGQTTDKDGKITYVLTLTAREQHIRRELATSNICSNHGLCALRASIYLSLLGQTGLRTCGLKNIENSHYIFKEISKLNKFKIFENQIFFNEFVVETNIDYKLLHKKLEENNILSFYPLEKDFSQLNNKYLVCATEMNSKEEIDQFIEILRSL